MFQHQYDFLRRGVEVGVAHVIDLSSTMAIKKRDNLSPWIYFDQITFDYGVLIKKNVILDTSCKHLDNKRLFIQYGNGKKTEKLVMSAKKEGGGQSTLNYDLKTFGNSDKAQKEFST